MIKPSQVRHWNQRVKSVRGELRHHHHRVRSSRYRRLIYILLGTNFVSVLLFGLRLVGAENFRYWFMLWNLFLAWIAPLVACYLFIRLKRTRWRTWQNIILTIIWLGFLPNSFYMISDLVHVQQTGEISVYYDTVLFISFVLNGMAAGYIGIMLIHEQLRRRVREAVAWACVAGVMLLASYAIYLGRVLRWNTWDALLQPAAVIFDVSDNILNPLAHPQAFVVTFSFTIVLGIFYALAWEIVSVLRHGYSSVNSRR